MTDYIIRATAAEGQIRAFAATTRDLVEAARDAHNTSPVATAALGRLLTAGAMMGIMMKGEKDLLTLRAEGDGPIGGLLVTAALGVGVLSVIRDIGLKEPYVGQTILVSGEIAEDLTYYYATSEQVPSSVALGVLMNKDNTVRQAGGFIIQLMPGASDDCIDRLEARLGEMSSITALLDAGKTPEEILEDLLGDMGLEILDRLPARFHCDCHKSRVARAITSIGKKELQSMIDEGKPIEVSCHFCNKIYTFTVDELKEMLEKATRP